MKLGYVIFYVPDVAATVAFYQRAFGLTLRFLHESGQYAELETGATALAFAQEDHVSANGVAFAKMHGTSVAPATEIGLVTQDIDASYKRAIDAGAAFHVPPTQKPWGQTVAYVRDCNGFLVELCTAMTS